MKLLRAIIITVLILSVSICTASCGKAYGKLMETKTDGELSFDIYGKNGNILRIEVNKNGNEVCALACNGKDLKLTDLNFDGNNDIMLASAERGDGYYQCFIYQPNTGKFTRNTKFDDMLNPVLDPETKTISCEIYSRKLISQDPENAYKEVRGSAVWYWKNGILSQFSEEGIEYFTDSKIFCVYTSFEVDGEFTRNDDKDMWFWSYEGLIAAGYKWDK